MPGNTVESDLGVAQGGGKSEEAHRKDTHITRDATEISFSSRMT